MHVLMQRAHRFQCITLCSGIVWSPAGHHLPEVHPMIVGWIVKGNHLEEFRILVFPGVETRELLYYLLWALQAISYQFEFGSC